MPDERLLQQIRFLLEIDRLKDILRQSYVLESRRRENSAEHSWHLAIAAVILAEHAEISCDVGRVVKMALVHDIVEIDAGDTYIYDPHYDEAAKSARENQAARRLFGLLPADQAAELRALWEEFEAGQSAEARFAAALDRLLPMLHNHYTQGRSWQEHGIRSTQVFARNRPPIEAASPALWAFAEGLLKEAIEKKYLPI
jgi:putative hydrolase of HD superfamily